MNFEKVSVSRENRFSLGIERDSQVHYLAIPMSNRLVDHLEYYKLSDDEYQAFREDPARAAEFAESCRRKEQDARLFMKPGTDRGIPH
ncbi:hypothetical protein ACN27E_13410 [Mycobacterium sp. WMMD1722]|uniref:hypothetical protein n=1 Tax=Mycobacterium sp. WMMD1722 TaxID=3404117 RepID=UPI003BF5B682